ncbi:hypothetical protein [Serratia plymuthica]|uniref:hypothetical protein n=1 Tax=Serratia plymuthica TaxID=82996 RepID=UPI0018D7E268|nr:hypothetical protein [Serratia plymuthica]QPS54765.1 hypothetical protein I6G53_19095 [Serratia plymuthica]UNK26906.1 hypothetical protein MNO11_19000 [Serratia plymuthica]CAI1622074.1 Uncharacterised protein [Serratia plymuthica]
MGMITKPMFFIMAIFEGYMAYQPKTGQLLSLSSKNKTEANIMSAPSVIVFRSIRGLPRWLSPPAEIIVTSVGGTGVSSEGQHFSRLQTREDITHSDVLSDLALKVG